MKIIIGNQYYPEIEGSSASIARSATDPVPTCTLNLRDINSTLKPQAMQEIIVLDDQAIPNPTLNMAPNPTLNPYTNTADWVQIAVTGVTLSQITGGGVKITCANVALNGALQQLLYTYMPGGGIVHGAVPGWGQIVPGQTYTASAYVQGSGSPSGFGVFVHIDWFDASLNFISGAYSSSPIPPSGTNTRYIVSSVAPANAAIGYMSIGITGPNATNSGSALVTNLQFEPNWFPTIPYPTPFCGPNQPNCQQLPLGQWIRQSRRFAGFVNHVTAQDYHGNARTLVVNAVGYAWLMGCILANDSFTNQADSAIISTLLTKYLTDTYLTAGGSGLLTTTSVITGVTISDLQANWDDLRSIFDGLCGQSGFYWTVDYYWDFVYAPPGYYSMGIELICDPSPNPDFVTTYPAYNFSSEEDFTQPGSSILVLGNGTNVAQVVDPAQTGVIGFTSGYLLPTGTTWMRKVNDSTLNSVADCTTRGSAELLQYDFTRGIYHLTTNVALTAGYGVPITSATEGLSASVQLIQQVTATWIGTNETLTDEWEYVADLGATNRNATNMISRIFRQTQKGSSAPAISATTLETFENIGIADSVALGTIVTNYATTIQADTPIAYYRLAEITGTIADDISGNAHQGTLNGGITQGVATLLTDAADSGDLAMTFNGTSGYILLPSAGTWPTGNGAWSLEAWCKPTSNTNTPNGLIVIIGNPGTNSAAGWIAQTPTGGWGVGTWGGAGHDFNGNGTSIAGATYYIVATYDGASNLNLYVTIGGAITHYGPFNPGTLALATSAHQSIGDGWNGSAQANWFNGIIDEPAIYNYKLSTTQIATHYAAGTSIYAYAVMQDTPLNYYRLGEASGTTANDASGDGHAGTTNGGVTLGTTGLLFNDANTAMTLNGSTGYISLPTTGLPTGASAWTVEVWWKVPSTVPSTWQELFHIGTFGGAGGAGMRVAYDGVNGHFRAENAAFSATCVGGPVVANGIYQVVATYNGTTLSLYVNAQFIQANPIAFALVASVAQIGLDEFGNHASGVFDEPAIYPVALSQARITAHYNAGTLGHQ